MRVVKTAGPKKDWIFGSDSRHDDLLGSYLVMMTRATSMELPRLSRTRATVERICLIPMSA
ncbi:MAG: hypothetical protein HY815_30215 [Candidatus Riflebacteria bacterium]|nr:hypothetical protein [Candidatus Riflebacteria bacterium]